MNAVKQKDPNGTPIQVLIVDDSPDFLAAVNRHLSLHAWADVVGTANSANAAVRLARELRPDLVLMDIVMPDRNGIDATREIKRLQPPPQVVIMTLHDNAEYRYQGRKAGADGFISKSEFETELPRLIEALRAKAKEHAQSSEQPQPPNSDLTALALRESEERLHFALEAGGMGISDWNLDTGAVTWSPEHARLFGLRLDQFDGSHAGFLGCVHPQDRAGIERAIVEAREKRAAYSHRFRVVWPDGSVHWLRGKGRFVYDAIGRRVRMLGAVIDISENIEAARALEGMEHRYRELFDGSPIGLFRIASDGRLLEVNDMLVSMSGHPDKAALLALNVSELYFDPSERHELLARVEREGIVRNFDVRFRRADGAIRWGRVNIRRLEGATEDEAGYEGTLEDINEQHEAIEKARFLAYHDSLTGLPNRLLLTDRLQQALIEAQRRNRLVGVVILGLDRFKTINDAYGHGVADSLLIEVAARLTKSLRPSDTVARFGGDTFAVVLADVAQDEDAPVVIERLLEAFNAPFRTNGHETFLSAGFGVALYPSDSGDVATLLRNAETAMHRGKTSGHAHFSFYTAEMTDRAHEDMMLESELRHAIDREELLLHYQPIIDLRTGHIQGVEALLRWHYPPLGLVSPARFIPIAEDSGLIVYLGEWVFETAFSQMRNWQRAGFTDLQLAVNLSPRQFREPRLAERIGDALAHNQLQGTRLELELTESMLLANIEQASAVMHELHTTGVRFAIDDFGTGYSSMSHLKRFPIDTLKIDRSFVQNVTTDSGDAAIVRATITLAHNLGMRLVAEGVETREQLRFLFRHECDAMQGYYFSKPVSASDVTIMLASGAALTARDHLNDLEP